MILFSSNDASFHDAAAAMSVGSVRMSELSEMLVHKKLDKRDKNLAQMSMSNSVNATKNSCGVSISSPSPNYSEESRYSTPTKAAKSCSLEHFLSKLGKEITSCAACQKD